MSRLDVYIDFKSAAAYLALRPTALLARETRATVRWLPFRTRQTPVPATKPDETKGETHRRIRAEYRRRMNLHYALLSGTPMQFPEHPGETDLALVGLTINPTYEFVAAAFEAYWVLQQNLMDADNVNALLRRTHSPVELPSTTACADIMQKSTDDAAAAGVIDTPTYVVGDELFVGREHLPWIRQLLTR